jgi:hypothetical protein
MIDLSVIKWALWAALCVGLLVFLVVMLAPTIEDWMWRRRRARRGGMLR